MADTHDIVFVVTFKDEEPTLGEAKRLGRSLDKVCSLFGEKLGKKISLGVTTSECICFIKEEDGKWENYPKKN